MKVKHSDENFRISTCSRRWKQGYDQDGFQIRPMRGTLMVKGLEGHTSIIRWDFSLELDTYTCDNVECEEHYIRTEPLTSD